MNLASQVGLRLLQATRGVLGAVARRNKPSQSGGIETT